MPHHSESLRIDQADEPSSRREYAPAVEHDVRLELARRIDWRFLLPDPRLGTVACIGCDDPWLRDALLMFCQSVVFFQSVDENAAPNARFDLVVLRGERADTLERAAALVRPGGFLYVEIERSLKKPSTWKVSPPRVAGVIRRLGLSNVALHWHYPGFTNGNTLVPIGDGGGSAHYFFDQQGSGLAKQCKSTLGRLLLASGLLNHFIGSFSVVGRKPAS